MLILDRSTVYCYDSEGYYRYSVDKTLIGYGEMWDRAYGDGLGRVGRY